MNNTTALYDKHLAAGAKIVDFNGWDMPLHYGSQLQEHQQVRRAVGMFDVSHMTIVDISGGDAKAFLRYLLANDVERLETVGKALYSALLNEEGGILDDLIVYRLNNGYRVIVNCGTRSKDLAWIDQQAANYRVNLAERNDLAMLAVQGPEALTKVKQVVSIDCAALIKDLKVFHAIDCGDLFIARTGYTGEDGLEIILPSTAAARLWQQLKDSGVAPCGLGARDTLRLEAGMNLYGIDMDESVTPLESNMEWTVAWEPIARQFIGRAALEQQRAQGSQRKLVGLVLEQKAVLRSHQKVIIPSIGEGEVTSGTFSPTLGYSIGLARVPAATKDSCKVIIRNQEMTARIVKPPFVRHNKKVFK